MDDYLKSLYYDSSNSGGFGSFSKLSRIIKRDAKFQITGTKLRNWLAKQENYTKHRSLKRKFPTLKVISPHKNYQWDGDTMNMTRYGKHNSGYSYILILIDITTRHLWTKPLKTLTGKEMVSALKSIFAIDKPRKIRTDSGSEFKNKLVESLLRTRDVDFFTTKNEKKANYAERVIKTLKSKLVRILNFKNSQRWIDDLSNSTKAYNGSYHRSIRMTPDNAMKTSDDELWMMQHEWKPLVPAKSFQMAVGDRVRLSHIRKPFDREYDEKWTDEVFQITDRTRKSNIPIYWLKDYDNDPILGSFYQSELQKISLDDETTYKVERIIKKRTRRGVKECFVKWDGWHRKFNSWIPETEIKDI